MGEIDALYFILLCFQLSDPTACERHTGWQVDALVIKIFTENEKLLRKRKIFKKNLL